jgi:tripartite-type tricarboxylate transporter receptor subunit TctC
MHFIVTLLLFVLGMTVSPRSSSALDYPTRSVRIMIPFSAGGAPDVLLRIVGRSSRKNGIR